MKEEILALDIVYRTDNSLNNDEDNKQMKSKWRIAIRSSQINGSDHGLGRSHTKVIKLGAELNALTDTIHC